MFKVTSPANQKINYINYRNGQNDLITKKGK